MARSKAEIITFKANQSLLEALEGIDNRSEFIRQAVLSALEGTCPLCAGSGTLTPRQREHWAELAADHSVQECGACHERHLVCTRRGGRAGGRGLRR